MNAAIAMSVLLEAMPMRNRTSRVEPIKIYGFQRPQHEIV